jgi:hypothetical protein
MKKQNQRLFFGSPTRDQAKRIAWNDLKALANPMITDKSESELMIKLASGSEIWVLGFDKPERFEGSVWNGGILDEYADMKESVLGENVMPALRDTGGWLWLIGVPAGKNHYYDLSEYARMSNDPEWADYCWLSKDVMSEAEVEKERARLDVRTFRQEYEGSFESYEGRAYLYYDATHHRVNQRFDENYPISITCDFNLDPCIWLIGQDKGGFISIQQEVKQSQTDIWKMCQELKERLGKLLGRLTHTQQIYIYGDYEHGQSRSVSATSSSWSILQDEFKQYNCKFKLKGHPRIVDRVNSVNSKLRSADGSVKIGIDTSCIELCKDFEQVSMDMLTGSKTKAGQRTHASDALGYWINYEYPVDGKSQIYMRT